MLRLFIAIDLPANVKQLLGEVQNQLRPCAPGVRWADPQGTHLTLFFLGQTPDERLDPVQLAMREAAAGTRRFRLATGTLGAFPAPARPRVLWLGVAGEPAALAHLQAAVVDAVAPLGFAREERPFAPHLTLGRARQGASAAELDTIASALRATPAPRVLDFDVSGIVLMRSERLPSGARYTVVSRVSLAGGG